MCDISPLTTYICSDSVQKYAQGASYLMKRQFHVFGNEKGQEQSGLASRIERRDLTIARDLGKTPATFKTKTKHFHPLFFLSFFFISFFFF